VWEIRDLLYSERMPFPSVPIGEVASVYQGMEIGASGFPIESTLRKQLGTLTASLSIGHISNVVPAHMPHRPEA
jgi:hypothetical protein